MDDLISVIIPIYKVEKWVRQCVDSVLMQTYENLEIILVDDGSPDKCPAICDMYAANDSRIKVVHKPNGGLSSARNVGLDVATGEYIVFVDSDDYIHPQMIENMYEIMEENQADIVICDLKRVNEDGLDLSDHFIDVGLTGIFNKDEIFERMYGPAVIYCVVSWNKLYHKNLWLNYRYPDGKIHEDEFAIHHILDKCEKIVCTDKCYYYYRQREGTIMTEKSVEWYLDALEAFLERQTYFMKNKMANYIVLQDRRCFCMLCETCRNYPQSRKLERYSFYRTKYYQLHRILLQKGRYPFLWRMQIALYRCFPIIIIVIGNCYRKIKSRLGKGGAENSHVT